MCMSILQIPICKWANILNDKKFNSIGNKIYDVINNSPSSFKKSSTENSNRHKPVVF